MIAALKALLKRHWPAIPLRVILFGALFFVAALPGVGAVGLRVYENTLVQQTEAELIAQGAALAAAARAAYGANAPPRVAPRPEPPRIDLRTMAVLPPRPAPEPTGLPPDPRAVRAARALVPIAAETTAVTLASVRLLDGQGVAVLGRGHLGWRYAHVPEVRTALAGRSATALRERADLRARYPLEWLSRAADIRVHHARPVVADGRVVGVVLLSRSPRGLFVGIWQDRGKIALGIGLIFLTLLLLAGLLSRGIARPILRLAAASEDVGSRRGGGRGRLDIPPPPATAAVEIRALYANFAAMAERVEARTRYLRDFAAAVSHEFKTPLTGIRGALELLEDHGEAMSAEERARFLRNAHADADRLARLTARLLELARADMAGGEDDANTDLVAVARHVALEHGRDGFDVQVHAPPAMPPGRVPADALAVALATLIENSRQAGARSVALRLTKDEESLRLSATDDGAGVPPADAARIFEPFFTNRRDHGGTGLGLPIARSLLAASGATLILASREEGAGGATFELRVPRSSA